jgi:very-short-patch-repair endonuclease
LDGVEKLFGLTIDRECCVESRYFDGKVGRVLIEIDGNHWHDSEGQQAIDIVKDAIALRNGFAIIRVELNRIKEVECMLQNYYLSLSKVFSLCGVIR